MQALTLHQPWATLLASGEKRYETRSWSTSYRGQIAIHAGLAKGPDLDEYARAPLFEMALADHDPSVRGAIIGVVELIACISTSSPTMPDGMALLDFRELAFGDFSPGRFGWLMTKPIMFERPIKCGGALQLWRPSLAIAEQIREAMYARRER